MKNLYVFLMLTAVLFSCKKAEVKSKKTEEVKVKKEERFPEALTKVFAKHGGIDAWKAAQTLSFNLKEEVHTSDLHSRKIVVNSPNYSLGFNGKETWITKKEGVDFNKNPDFYYNLFFYFYAMPFVLADDGITYNEVDPIVFEGVSYPGYQISYEAHKGTSPDDNYIIYYHPETFQMEWLAYTVTFALKKPSKKYNLIKYHKWGNVSGLMLPEEITWYTKDEHGNPKKPARPATKFTLPLVSKEKLADSFFEKPVN